MSVSMAAPLGIFAAILASPAAADLAIATWNIDGGQRTPAELRSSAAEMEADAGEIDLLALQEVISEEQVQAIADGLGLDHWAISDFSPPIEIT